jgi:hypothetical protein
MYPVGAAILWPDVFSLDPMEIARCYAERICTAHRSLKHIQIYHGAWEVVHRDGHSVAELLALDHTEMKAAGLCAWLWMNTVSGLSVLPSGAG